MHGGFELSFKPSLVSASTTEVSALMNAKECLPGGTGCDYWLAVTLRVPSGHSIALRSLFSKPVAGLATLARLAKETLLRSDTCIAASPNKSGFEPTWHNYEAFALTPQGVAVGFATSAVGFPECGPVEVIVPTERIVQFLNPFGRRLLDDARRPG